MGDRKNMVVPGTRDAPKFVSSKPKELSRLKVFWSLTSAELVDVPG